MVPILFDAGSVWARAYFAAASAGFESQMLGGVHISLKTVGSILSSRSGKLYHPPTHCLFCWDGEAKRDKGREKKPTEYYAGMPETEALLTTVFGATHCHPKNEADDAVGTAAIELARRRDVEAVYIVSGDKDLQQVVDGEKIYYYSLNEHCVMSYQTILDKWHIKHPSQLGIVLAILGDAVDKIEGVHGWGRKKVQKLFESVTEDMPLSGVVEHVMAGMNDDQRNMFLESLHLTLLQLDIPNIPEPGKIRIGGFEELEARGWGDLYAWLVSVVELS